MTTPLFIASPVELGLLAGILILLFGAQKLPAVARALGRAPGEFERGHQEDTE